MSQLVSLLFGNCNHGDIKNVRYLIHEILKFGSKIIRTIHKINFLCFCKKYGIIPSNFRKHIDALTNIGNFYQNGTNRRSKMNAECINLIIKNLGQEKYRCNNIVYISWNNMKITLDHIYNKRDYTIPLKMTENFIKEKFLHLHQKLNDKYSSKTRHIMNKKENVEFYPFCVNIDRNDLIRQSRYNKISIKDEYSFNTVSISIYMDSINPIFRNNPKKEKIKNIEDIEKFLENKGPTYNIRTEPIERTMEKFKGEFNQFLIRYRTEENRKKMNEQNNTEVKRDNIVIPLENRRIFLPEKLDLYEEKKLREVFNRIKDTINEEYQKELDTRRTENIKIKQMKKILKESDRVLVNTDKTKRIKIISTEEYYKAGEKFLGDEKQYRKLKTNHSIDIEKKANAIIKKLNQEQE